MDGAGGAPAFMRRWSSPAERVCRDLNSWYAVWLTPTAAKPYKPRRPADAAMFRELLAIRGAWGRPEQRCVSVSRPIPSSSLLAAMVSTDHTKMVKWPPWARILHLPYLPIPKLVFLT